MALRVLNIVIFVGIALFHLRALSLSEGWKKKLIGSLNLGDEEQSAGCPHYADLKLLTFQLNQLISWNF